jgi:hypothetical protein
MTLGAGKHTKVTPTGPSACSLSLGEPQGLKVLGNVKLSSAAARTTEYICGICRLGTSSRFSKVIETLSWLLPYVQYQYPYIVRGSR